MKTMEKETEEEQRENLNKTHTELMELLERLNQSLSKPDQSSN